MSRNNKNEAPELSMQDLEQITFDAMRHCGMVLPITTEEIAAIEAELLNVKLPFGPSDPRELLKRLDVSSENDMATVLSFPMVDTDSVNNLARAARQGGELSQEVELRMAEDKAKYLHNEHGEK